MIYEHGESWWNDIGRGNPKNLEESLSQYHFSTTNPTWTDKVGGADSYF
jgi:hypothetical protein